MRTLSVIIPCYNEAATVAEVVEKVQQAELPKGWQKEIIVVDDGSETKTKAALHTIAEQKKAIKIVYREKNGGKGAAVKEGLRHVTGDYCIIQDADLELDPNDYHALIKPIENGEAEVVFGYRVLAKTDAPASPLLFHGGRMLSFFFNIMFFTWFKDIPACYKIFPRSYIPSLLETPSDDFVFDSIEMTYVLSRNGNIAQVPIRYYPRTHAQGKKLRIEDGMRSAVTIVLLRFGLHHLPIAKEIGYITRFLISGTTTAMVSLAVLYTLTEYAHVWYLASSVIAFCISYAVNFTLQKFWTFKNKGLRAIQRQLPLHLSLAIFNLALNTAILYALVEWGDMWYLLAQVLAALIIAIESFFISKKIFSRL